MKITAGNVNVVNTVTGQLTVGTTRISESLNIGNVNFTPSSVTVGAVVINSTAISSPSLVVGGIQYAGGLFSGVIDYQEFTANGTWYNPFANASANSTLTGNEQVFMMLWGGGGGSAANGTVRYDGGGGGACKIFTGRLNTFTNTCAVTIGLGGAGVSGVQASAGAGDNTVFVINSSANVIAYGGMGGSSLADRGGGGGGTNARPPVGGNGGDPLGSSNSATAAADSTFGGGGGGANGGASVFGGGGGGWGGTLYSGGDSIFGGGGGAGLSGISVFGGAGGNSSTAASAPGGGAPAVATTGQVGAKGEARIWVFGRGESTKGPPTVNVVANTTTLNEGMSVLFTVTTLNIANNTTLYYTLNGTSTANSSDFSSASNGSFVVRTVNGVETGSFTLTAKNDTDTNLEPFRIDIRKNSTTGAILASNSSVSIIPAGQQLFTTNGTFTVPPNVTNVSIVAVGAGGACDGGVALTIIGGTPIVGATGGGGALSYTNGLAVTPGEVLTVTVGEPAFLSAGGDSSVSRGATTLILAKGGDILYGGNAALGIGSVKRYGGNGDNPGGGQSIPQGGGGAAGYSGNGGNSKSAGTGGGGGGGGQGKANPITYGDGGGGVGMLGEGASGSSGGGGGSGGGNGGAGTQDTAFSTGGKYGGGSGSPDALAGSGAVRIIWGANRLFPNTNTGDL